MNWIKTSEKHFVDIEPDGTWIENNNCPIGPFLVGLHTYRVGTLYNPPAMKVEFEWYKVKLTEDGVEEVGTDGNLTNPGWSVQDIEFWMPITHPGVTTNPIQETK